MINNGVIYYKHKSKNPIMAIRSDAYKGSRNTKHEDDILKQKISQVQEITQCTEETALMTLHDCEYNVEAALNKIICQEPSEAEWCKLQKRGNRKAAAKAAPPEKSAETVPNGDKAAPVIAEPRTNVKALPEGKCFKNHNLMKNFKGVQRRSSPLVKKPSTNATKTNLESIWDGKTFILYNPDYFSQNFNSKKIQAQKSEKASQVSPLKVPEASEELVVFKTRCSTKPPPKSIYTLSSPVRIINKHRVIHNNSSLPRFTFGDSQIENSLLQLSLQNSKSTAKVAKTAPTPVDRSNASTDTPAQNLATNFTNISTHTNQLLNDYYYPSNSGFIDNTQDKMTTSVNNTELTELVAPTGDRNNSNIMYDQNNYLKDDENNAEDTEPMMNDNIVDNVNSAVYHQTNDNYNASINDSDFQSECNVNNSAANPCFNASSLYLVPNLMMNYFQQNGYYMALNNSTAVAQSQFPNQSPATLTNNQQGNVAPSQPFPSNSYPFTQHSSVYAHRNDSHPEHNMDDKKELSPGAQLLQHIQQPQKVASQPVDDNKRYEYFKNSPPLPDFSQHPSQFMNMNKGGPVPNYSQLRMASAPIYLTSNAATNTPSGGIPDRPPHNVPSAIPPPNAMPLNNAAQILLNNMQNTNHHHQVPNYMQHNMNAGYNNMKKQPDEKQQEKKEEPQQQQQQKQEKLQQKQQPQQQQPHKQQQQHQQQKHQQQRQQHQKQQHQHHQTFVRANVPATNAKHQWT